MADDNRVEMLFRSSGALLVLALAGTLPVSSSPGQEPIRLANLEQLVRLQPVGDPALAGPVSLPSLDGCVLVDAPRSAVVDAAVHLLVMLPTGRAELLAAERRLVQWSDDLDGSLRIDAVLPAAAAGLAGLRRRGPRGDHRRWIDDGGQVGLWFESITGDGSGACYALADSQRQVLRAGRLDGGLRGELADALTGRLDAAVAARLVDREGLLRSGSKADGGEWALAGYVHWLDVVGRIDHLAWPQGDRELQRLVDDALIRFADRPVWLARVAESVLQHSPALAADARIRKALAEGLRVDKLDSTLRRVAFRIHAGVGDDRRARGHGMAWLEAVKSVPGRCHEVLDVLEQLPRGARRFQDLTERVFEVGMAAAPDDGWLARKAFEHHASISGDASATRDFGTRYVATLEGDAQALNSFAWKLLTADGYVGKHQELALVAARAMSTDVHWRSYWRLDTLALACFENGQFAEAVALQQEAVEAAADGSAAGRYAERLARYREVLAARRR